ncbi:mitogen-activated protein kinase-binding protein 1-like [Aplysia californica]|uniref:Mitogen-activated protein kinase-binding protein 1-like n=1 Tax=Aplysia californica TaxID=6500 RepID=A0ABM1W2H3_APLCA|nr:mitogen-activated protein kinase-binding protein 1-like [Aplysia californica]
MDSVRPQRKVLRSPSVKRKSKVLPVNQRVHLERVLGVTVSSNAGLSCDSNNGTIAYPAGCVVVLFNPRRNKQSHIFNASKKTITALSISSDGKLLATGETGHQPAVRVWDVVEKTQLAEFRGHKFGINCVVSTIYGRF